MKPHAPAGFLCALLAFIAAPFFAVSLSGQSDIPTQHGTVIDYLHNPPQDLPGFEPARDQTKLEGILAAVGDNVSALFANLLNISAVEKVQLEKLGKKGEAEPGKRFEYLYLCAGAVDQSDPSFDEYRSDAEGHEISQLGLDKGYMLTSGFVSAPLLFHPLHQQGSSFSLLGYQKLKERNAIVMAYAQIPDRSRLPGYFRTGRNVQRTFKQGMVWIDAENCQIVRLVSDLLTPLPQIKLDKLQTQIDFDRVQFSRNAQTFWLPVQVIVTVHWDGKVLRNTHTYSDFKLFNVEATLKIAKPSVSGQTEEEPSTPERGKKAR